MRSQSRLGHMSSKIHQARHSAPGLDTDARGPDRSGLLLPRHELPIATTPAVAAKFASWTVTQGYYFVPRDTAAAERRGMKVVLTIQITEYRRVDLKVAALAGWLCLTPHSLSY